MFRCETALEMIGHLIGFHRARGDRVPDAAIARLIEDVTHQR